MGDIGDAGYSTFHSKIPSINKETSTSYVPNGYTSEPEKEPIYLKKETIKELRRFCGEIDADLDEGILIAIQNADALAGEYGA